MQTYEEFKQTIIEEAKKDVLKTECPTISDLFDIMKPTTKEQDEELYNLIFDFMWENKLFRENW